MSRYWPICAVPTLLISGENDPSTPMSFRESAAEALSRGRHLVIPGGTHIHRTACLNGLVEELLLHADPDSVDPGCLE